jgi:propanediol dehydratase large subunit
VKLFSLKSFTFSKAINTSVPLNVEPTTTARHSSSEQSTTWKCVRYNADHNRLKLVGGLQVKWDTVLFHCFSVSDMQNIQLQMTVHSSIMSWDNLGNI